MTRRDCTVVMGACGLRLVGKAACKAAIMLAHAIISLITICCCRCSVEHLAAKRGRDASVERGITIKDLSPRGSWCQVGNHVVCWCLIIVE